MSFIVVTDGERSGVTYFSDFVYIYSNYFIVDTAGVDSNEVAAKLNVTIYSSSNATFENMLQTSFFDSSCSSTNLVSLGDRYGAIQLAAFNTSLQGRLSDIFIAVFETAVINKGKTDVKVVSFISEASIGFIANWTGLVSPIVYAGNMVTTEHCHFWLAKECFIVH